MSRISKRLTLLFATTCLACWGMQVEAANPPRAAAPSVWPRSFDADRQHVELYQPQIETWEGNRIAGRAAVAVGASDGTPTYGVAHFSAIVEIDRVSGLAQLTHVEIASVDVPTNPGVADQTRQVLLTHLPSAGLTTSLDELQTSYSASKQLAATQRMAVQNEAPRIVFATRPTVLVLVDGAPVWRPVNGAGYQRALNSRALLLQDGSGTLYLHAAGYWYSAASAGGQWGVRTAPPQALLAAAQLAEASGKADPLMPANGQRPARAPVVLFATEPTELIVTDGQMKLTPVEGVSLLTVANSDHAVFVDPATNQYYVLLSGRWFRAASEGGPWQYVSGSELPADFAKISPRDPKANVLVSIPGTPQAKEAAIAATIAQTATVSRASATLTVAYDGAPRFTPIAGTALSYAVNTGTPVIAVDSTHYYAVSNGIWFTAAAPDGTWRVATEVPGAIYAIPASSPLHYVVYVRIYSVTPETVVVGYTPGYMGVVVNAEGTVVYGTGYVYPPYVGAVYYGYPPTYGYDAGFALNAAAGFAFGFAAGAIWGAAEPYWGPYWGGGGWNNVNVNQANFYGRWGQGTVTHASGWNPWTGTQGRGSAVAGHNPATGAHFQGSRGAAFNPYSGNYAAGRQGSFANPSTGRGGAARGGIAGNQYNGNFAGGRQVAGYNAQTGRAGAAEFGVAGNTYTGQYASAGKGIVTNQSKGNAVAWNNGDVYAGHDGNVYQHTQGGGWQQHTANGWQSVQPKADVGGDLEQQREARDVGQQRFDHSANQWGDGRGSRGAGRFGGEGGFAGGGMRRGGFRR
ncbi:carbohydrate-binding family V/XII [Paraburkholderia xenovorans]|uniref:carbohydrate-binding family V/XII n=1 Tax=Paraburkholderia xenovorans TaxID=36873 RepID=UPI0015C561B1|nr:carbohydrate-binding family V/XII [Paraburkholderia xenovorans]NPT37978.1 carbohydrate-binding family V/XII [Paraburkholderia xenovorans]